MKPAATPAPATALRWFVEVGGEDSNLRSFRNRFTVCPH